MMTLAAILATRLWWKTRPERQREGTPVTTEREEPTTTEPCEGSEEGTPYAVFPDTWGMPKGYVKGKGKNAAVEREMFNLRNELRHRCVTFGAMMYPWKNRDGSVRYIEPPPVLVVSEKGGIFHRPRCHYIQDRTMKKKMVTPCQKCFPLGMGGSMELSEDDHESGADQAPSR